jgi:hypothetical protein
MEIIIRKTYDEMSRHAAEVVAQTPQGEMTLPTMMDMNSETKLVK